jgi:lipid-A-disaccharide synthase
MISVNLASVLICTTFTITKEIIMKYYLVAGEASGDLHASNLMKSIKKLDHNADFRFFGGDLMKSVGGMQVKHYSELAYMGFFPVVTHLGKILGGAKLCYEDIAEWKPDAVILIDYPGFNLSIAKRVRKNLHIPVLYYISPKIWAWKSYRIKNIKRDVSRLFSILPFEIDYFNNLNYKVDYVGNPCVDSVSEYLRSNGEKTDEKKGKPVLALLAGSRKQEISRNLPVMIDAIKDLDEFHPVLACAPGITPDFYARFIEGKNIETVYGHTYDVLNGARAALVTSGTATLETALFNVPQVVCYYMPFGKIVSLLRRLFLKVEFISLVNLVLGREVVPELVGDKMNVADIRKHLIPLLNTSSQRDDQLKGYEELKSKLGPEGASDLAASGIARYLSLK